MRKVWCIRPGVNIASAGFRDGPPRAMFVIEKSSGGDWQIADLVQVQLNHLPRNASQRRQMGIRALRRVMRALERPTIPAAHNQGSSWPRRPRRGRRGQ